MVRKFYTASASLPEAQLIAYYLREPPRNIASGRILAVHGSTGPPAHRIGVDVPDACSYKKFHRAKGP